MLVISQDIELLCASFSLTWNADILKAAYLNWASIPRGTPI